MKVQHYLDRAAALIERDLLPDICTIETVGAAPSIDDMGVLTPGTSQVTYLGSPNIPCRLDSSRSFRPDKLPNQEINVNEYVLHLPRAVYVRPNDKVRVTVDGRIHTFEVRKLTALSEWRVTNEALISELEGQHD